MPFTRPIVLLLLFLHRPCFRLKLPLLFLGVAVTLAGRLLFLLSLHLEKHLALLLVLLGLELPQALSFL